MKYLNNYKLYSKIDLTLHMDQFHSPHISGVHTGVAWCTHCAYLVHA